MRAARRSRGFAVDIGQLGALPYLAVGDGDELVVVIPGIDDSVHQFRWFPRAWAWYFAPLAARGRRVVVLSRPRALPPTCTTEALAELYAATIGEHLGAVHVVGISMGGLIAQHLAARHPHLVRRLALVVTGAQLGDVGCAHGERLSALAADGRWRSFFAHVGDICFTGRHRAVVRAFGWIWGARAFGRRRRVARDFAASARACASHDGAPLLAAIRAPTLVWATRDDCLFPLDVATRLARAIPGASLHLVDGAHAAFIQRRSELHRVVGRFFAARPAAAAPDEELAA